MQTFQKTEKALCSKYIWWIKIKSSKQWVFKTAQDSRAAAPDSACLMALHVKMKVKNNVITISHKYICKEGPPSILPVLRAQRASFSFGYHHNYFHYDPLT